MKDRKDEWLKPQKIFGTDKAWYYVSKGYIDVIVESHPITKTFRITTRKLRRLLKLAEQK